MCMITDGHYSLFPSIFSNNFFLAHYLPIGHAVEKYGQMGD